MVDIGEGNSFDGFTLREVYICDGSRMFDKPLVTEVDIIPTSFELILIGDILIHIGFVLCSVVC
jgi:hypothetical protein